MDAAGKHPVYRAGCWGKIGFGQVIFEANVRMLSSILGGMAVVYLAFAGLLYVMQDHLVYFPVRELAATPRDRGLEYEEVSLLTEDGVNLHGWFIPTPEARAVLLYFHGNAGNVSHRLERIALFQRLGLSVLIIDYRGYGRSAGRPSEAGTYHDAMAAWRYLTAERGVAPEKIVLFGRSLGAAVAAWLATQTAPGALILESGFTSVPDLGAEVYPWLPVRWLARFDYPTKAYVAKIHRPVLIVHSRDDDLVPFRHGQELHAAANPPKQFLEIRGGHNDAYFLTGADYARGVDRFLAESLARAAGARN